MDHCAGFIVHHVVHSQRLIIRCKASNENNIPIRHGKSIFSYCYIFGLPTAKHISWCRRIACYLYFRSILICRHTWQISCPFRYSSLILICYRMAISLIIQLQHQNLFCICVSSCLFRFHCLVISKALYWNSLTSNLNTCFYVIHCSHIIYRIVIGIRRIITVQFFNQMLNMIQCRTLLVIERYRLIFIRFFYSNSWITY